MNERDYDQNELDYRAMQADYEDRVDADYDAKELFDRQSRIRQAIETLAEFGLSPSARVAQEGHAIARLFGQRQPKPPNY